MAPATVTPLAAAMSAEDVEAGSAVRTLSQKDAAAVGKVLGFLKQIRGLHTHSPDDLAGLIWDNRFDLVPHRAIGADTKPPLLPVYSSVPSQQEVHDLLLSGTVPQGYHCVASVLYPDSIPWPLTHSENETVGAAVSSTAGPEDEGNNKDQSQEVQPQPIQQQQQTLKQQDQPRSPKRRPSQQRSSQGHVGGPPHSQPREGSSPSEGNAPQTEAQRKDEQLARYSKWSSGNAHIESLHDHPTVEISICGQIVKATARGHPIHQPTEDPLNSTAGDDADDEKYKIAHARRQSMDRTLKLQQYEGKKLNQAIADLENLKKVEIQRQEDIKKREAARLARKEELQEQLRKDVDRKIVEESAAREADLKRKEEELEAERKRKMYHERQKEVVKEYYEKRAASEEPVERNYRQRKEEIEAERREKLEERIRSKPLNLKQKAIDARVNRIHEAIEERPPLPPKPHDLPRPVLDIVDDEGRASKPNALPKPLSWTCQARVVSNAYGLSDREAAHIEQNMLQGIKGSGRMGVYDR